MKTFLLVALTTLTLVAGGVNSSSLHAQSAANRMTVHGTHFTVWYRRLDVKNASWHPYFTYSDYGSACRCANWLNTFPNYQVYISSN